MAKLALLGGKKIRQKPFPTHPVMGKEEKEQVLSVLKTGLLSGFIAKAGSSFLGGPKVQKLEEEFAKYFGAKYAIAVNSATAGLHCAVGALSLGPGDEIIVSPYTMSASASAILMSNAIPVFVDIKEDIFCIDPEKIKKAITNRTKAIIVVHLFGQSADMDEIMGIAKNYGLKVIEDCAQAPAAKYKNKFVGTFGDVGIFSFNQHKTITTGEGGVVITNNADIALKVRLVRNHGEVIVSDMKVKDIVNCLGWNYRMTELEAAVGIAQFRKLDFLTNYRVELAEYFTDELKKLNIVALVLPVIYPWNKHVYFVYPIKFISEKAGISRNTFVEAINAEGIPFGAGYVKPIYLEPMYQKKICYGKLGCPFQCSFYKREINYSKGLCPITERMYEKELMITSLCRYPLKKSDIRDIVNGIEKIFDNIKDLKKYEEKKKKREK